MHRSRSYLATITIHIRSTLESQSGWTWNLMWDIAIQVHCVYIIYIQAVTQNPLHTHPLSLTYALVGYTQGRLLPALKRNIVYQGYTSIYTSGYIFEPVFVVVFLQQCWNMHFIQSNDCYEEYKICMKQLRKTLHFGRKVLWTQGIHFTGTGDKFTASFSQLSPLLKELFPIVKKLLSGRGVLCPSEGKITLHETAAAALGLKKLWLLSNLL